MTSDYIMVLKRLLFVLFMLGIFSPAYGMNLTINPENPSVGDDITVSGDAAPNQTLSPSITFEKTVGARGGIYDYKLPGITIPSGASWRLSRGIVALCNIF